MKARVFFHLLVAVVIATIVAVGCAKAPNDAKIATDIQAKLSADSGLQGKQISVQSASGTVTISGTVDNDAQRDAAARYAASEPAVKQVVNNLQITPPVQAAQAVPPPPPPVEQPKPSPAPKKRHKAKEEAPPPVDNTPPPPPAPVQQAAADTPPSPPPPPPPPPPKVTIASGTALSIRLVDPIDSEKNQTGDVIHATLNSPITVNGDTVVPSGVDVQGHLVDVKSAGKFAGQSQIVFQLDSITSGGQTYNIQTDQYTKQGSSRGKNTAEKVGAGAGIGAIIGALAGGGKGAAIGAAAGGGLGAGAQAVTKSQQIKLASETVLNFTLQAPLTVVANSQNLDAGRQKLNQ